MAARRTAAPTPRIRCRSPPPRSACDILDETAALETIAAYGERLKAGIKAILDRRGIVHSFSGHPSMFGLFFAAAPPDNYRDWKRSDYTFYDAMAQHLHDLGIICEPDSREPWFMCEAHDTSLPRRHAEGLRDRGRPDARAACAKPSKRRR